MQRKPHLFSRRPQAGCLASLDKPPLSIWQSAILASASAKYGITFTNIERPENWLRKNSQNRQDLTPRGGVWLIGGRATKLCEDIPTRPTTNRRMIRTRSSDPAKA
jgi:hypothetical protein